MQRLKHLVTNFLDKLEKRSQREKILFALTALVAIFILWHVLVYQGQKERLTDLQQQYAATQKEITSLSKEQSSLSGKLNADKQEKLKQEALSLREEIADLDSKLRNKTGELVSPRQMAKQLRGIMQHGSGLELMHMANKSPEKVTLESLGGSVQKIQSVQLPEIYRHPLSVTFRGSFSQALKAFRSLQGISSGFFWDGLKFQVVDHPRARVHLEAHTLSLEKVWLGF